MDQFRHNNYYGVHFYTEQIFIGISHEISTMNKHSSTAKSQLVSTLVGNLPDLMDTGTITLLALLINNLLFPLLHNYVPNMRKRIGIGIFLVIVAATLRIVIEIILVHKGTTSKVIVLPMIPLSLGEILIFVTGI